MNYFLFIKDEKIIGAGQCQLIGDVINFEVTKELFDEYTLTSNKFIWEDNNIAINPEYATMVIETREQTFLSQFFEIPEYGFFRKQPKGYSSAVESLNTAFNIVSIIGNLPAGTLTFYEMPDFTIEEQCTEEWLVANSYKNDEMTATEFGKFYADFMTAWNTQEHQ